MTEKPILFSGPMVRAILDGRKTQTRRPLKDQDPFDDFQALPPLWTQAKGSCPFGEVGDRLWVRETWCVSAIYDSKKPSQIRPIPKVRYPATDRCIGLKKRQSNHMPRWASRINLEIVGVRVERLRRISLDDVFAEGMPEEDAEGFEEAERAQIAGFPLPYGPAERYWFIKLWDSKAKKGYRWDDNPWVWVIEFKLLEGDR